MITHEPGTFRIITVKLILLSKLVFLLDTIIGICPHSSVICFVFFVCCNQCEFKVFLRFHFELNAHSKTKSLLFVIQTVLYTVYFCQPFIRFDRNRYFYFEFVYCWFCKGRKNVKMNFVHVISCILLAILFSQCQAKEHTTRKNICLFIMIPIIHTRYNNSGVIFFL